MKRVFLITAVIASFLLVCSMAQAALVNYIDNPGFESAAPSTRSTYGGDDTIWYRSSSNFGRENSSANAHSGSYSMYLADNYSQAYLYQVVNMQNQTGHTFTVSFWVNYANLTGSNNWVRVYQSANEPAYNSFTSSWGTAMTPNAESSSTSFSGSSGGWVQRTYTFTPAATSNWFAIVISADTSTSGATRRFRIDDVSMVPIPPAALLLASGLLGLVGLRRFRKKD